MVQQIILRSVFHEMFSHISFAFISQTKERYFFGIENKKGIVVDVIEVMVKRHTIHFTNVIYSNLIFLLRVANCLFEQPVEHSIFESRNCLELGGRHDISISSMSQIGISSGQYPKGHATAEKALQGFCSGNRMELSVKQRQRYVAAYSD